MRLADTCRMGSRRARGRPAMVIHFAVIHVVEMKEYVK